MAEIPACPPNDRLEQFLNARLSDEKAAQMESHLLECAGCLQRAMAARADDPVINNALRAAGQHQRGRARRGGRLDRRAAQGSSSAR